MSKSRFCILPVIDLMDGQVVRGVGGHRQRYDRIESCLTNEASPRSIARMFVEEFAASEVYVADLDAIGGRQPDWHSLDEIAASGMRIWLDCGVDSVAAAHRLRRSADAKPYLASLVVGLESIRAAADLPAICSTIGRQRAVFSLDLKHGRPFTSLAELVDLPPLEIALIARQAGFQRVIVLDLVYVGNDRGIGVARLCQQMHASAGSLEIFAGGGVRSIADLRLLADAGCSGALVASALHSGAIVSSQLADFQSRFVNPG